MPKSYRGGRDTRQHPYERPLTPYHDHSSTRTAHHRSRSVELRRDQPILENGLGGSGWEASIVEPYDPKEPTFAMANPAYSPTGPSRGGRAGHSVVDEVLSVTDKGLLLKLDQILAIALDPSRVAELDQLRRGLKEKFPERQLESSQVAPSHSRALQPVRRQFSASNPPPLGESIYTRITTETSYTHSYNSTSSSWKPSSRIQDKADPHPALSPYSQRPPARRADRADTELPMSNNQAPVSLQDAELAARTVFFHGISRKSTEQEVLKLFSLAGTVAGSWLPKKDKTKSKMLRGIGRIFFKTPDDAHRAVNLLDGIFIYTRKLHVQMCDPRKLSDYFNRPSTSRLLHDAPRRRYRLPSTAATGTPVLYLSNLCDHADEEDVVALASRIGELRAVELLRSNDGVSRRQAWVQFQDPSLVAYSAQVFDGRRWGASELHAEAVHDWYAFAERVQLHEYQARPILFSSH